MLEAFDYIYFRIRIDVTFLGTDEKLMSPGSRCVVYKANQFKKNCTE